MSTLRQLQGDVARRLRRGDSFAAVEEQVIDRSPLSDEEKAALWLYGWSFVSRPRQRKDGHLSDVIDGLLEQPIRLFDCDARFSCFRLADGVEPAADDLQAAVD